MWRISTLKIIVVWFLSSWLTLTMRNTELNTEISSQENLIESDLSTSKKVDVNVLLNRVKAEKNSEVRKNLIITAGALSTLAVTGIIAIL